MGSGLCWLAGNWPSTGGVLNITAAAWTAGFQWWRSGDIRRTQNVSEYMLVLALCLYVQVTHVVTTARCQFQLSIAIFSVVDYGRPNRADHYIFILWFLFFLSFFFLFFLA